MNERKQRPGVMLYFDTLCPALARLTNEQRGELLQGIVEYAQTGAIPDLDGMTGMAFDLLRPGIDRDAERYEDIREKRRYATYCREAERRGETPTSFEEWQLMITNDNTRYPTTTSSSYPSPTTYPSVTPSSTAAAYPYPAADAPGKGETEGCKGDERENPATLHAQFIEAVDAGNMKTAGTLANRLFALGYDVDKDTKQMTRRGQ